MSTEAKKGTRSKSQQKGRKRFRRIFRTWRKETAKKTRQDDEMQCATVFEVCDAPRRPAVALQTEYKLKWKDGKPRHESSAPYEDIDFDEVQKTKQFQIARKIMVQLRRCNLLETIVSHDNLPIVKNFFKENLENPTPKVIEIIDHAMEICYKEVMFHQERYDLLMDNDMREFLLNKQKAKQCLLDVILICPEFVPLMWGGEAVGLPSDEEMAKAPHTDSQEGVASPWQKVVKKASAAAEAKEKALREARLTGGPAGSMELIKSWEKKRAGDASSRSDKSSPEHSDSALTERQTKSVDSIDDDRIWTSQKKPATSVEKLKKRSYTETRRGEEPKKSSGFLSRMKSKIRGKKSVGEKNPKRITAEKLRKSDEEAQRSSDSEEKSREGLGEKTTASRENIKKAQEREKQLKTITGNLKTVRDTVRNLKSTEKKAKSGSKDIQKSIDSAEISREGGSETIRRSTGTQEKTKLISSVGNAVSRIDNTKTSREYVKPRRAKTPDRVTMRPNLR